MPHVIVEFSSNLVGSVDVDGLLGAVHQCVLDSGMVPEDGLRTRGERRDQYVIADGDPRNSFVAVTIRLATGRPLGRRQALLAAVVDAVDVSLGEEGRRSLISAECQEIEPDSRVNRNNLRLLSTTDREE